MPAVNALDTGDRCEQRQQRATVTAGAEAGTAGIAVPFCFDRLERELAAAIAADTRRALENDAKLRAVEQRVDSYQQFRDIVKAAAMKPLDRKERMATTRSVGVNAVVRCGVRAGAGNIININNNSSSRDALMSAPAAAVTLSVESPSPPLPATRLEFVRLWRRRDVAGRVCLLGRLGAARVKLLVRSADLTGQLLTQLLEALRHQLQQLLESDSDGDKKLVTLTRPNASLGNSERPLQQQQQQRQPAEHTDTVEIVAEEGNGQAFATCVRTAHQTSIRSVDIEGPAIETAQEEWAQVGQWSPDCPQQQQQQQQVVATSSEVATSSVQPTADQLEWLVLAVETLQAIAGCNRFSLCLQMMSSEERCVCAELLTVLYHCANRWASHLTSAPQLLQIVEKLCAQFGVATPAAPR